MPAHSPIPASCPVFRRLCSEAGVPLRLPSVATAGALALVLCVFGTATAQATPATFNGNSVDGSIVVFSTSEKLLPGDTDALRDVYERSFDESLGEYVTREVSIGPLGGNDARDAQYDGLSSNGEGVFFSTREPLVSGDNDKASDIYMRDLATNETILVSQGDASCASEGCGNAEMDADFVPGGLVPAGDKVFFTTDEQLAAGDGDSAFDIYMRDLATNETILVSQGDASCASEGCGNGPFFVDFKQASTSGTKVFFTTSEELVAGDEEGFDIYERDLEAKTTALVSTAGTCPESLPQGQNCNPNFRAASSDGSHVFFETLERVSPEDTDSSQDVYDWSGGAATRASFGPDGGNGAFNVTYSGSSADGASVYFKTSEALNTTTDTDEGAPDIYERSGGVTSLVSTGPEDGNGSSSAGLSWVSPDDSTSTVFFITDESLVAADTDESQDIYEHSGGVTSLVPTGPAGGNGAADVTFAKASNDGSHVFFITDESLVAADTDVSKDIYERSGGVTSLVSTGPLDGNGPFTPGLNGISENGSIAFFTTEERMTEGDIDPDEVDIYKRKASGTLLMSIGNAKPVGPPPPSQLSTIPNSPPRESTTPSIRGQAQEGSAITIYTTPDCSGKSVATGTAEEFATTGIPVSVAVGSTTTFRAIAEADGITSACSNGVTYKQENPPPPPPPPPPNEEESSGGSGGTTGSGSGSSSIGGTKTSGRGIAYVTPETRITFGPSFKTKRRKIVFRFTDATGQPGTGFICRLDRRHWRPCGSPVRLKRLRRGKHVFKVKAKNAVGVWEAKPTRRKFKVVRGKGKRRLHRRHRRSRRS